MDKKTKILVGVLLVLGAVASIINVVRLTLIKKDEYKETALAFKEEYEKVNGKTMIKDINYRELNIDKNNPYVKVSIDEIANKIKNGESFYLYYLFLIKTLFLYYSLIYMLFHLL